MKQYIDIVSNVLSNGEWKKNRTGTRCLTTFCEIFRHDMSKGFPLLTTRRVPWKSLRVELEGFIKGITDKRWYQERGCKYWDYWANPRHIDQLTEVRNNPNNQEIRKGYQEVEHDLGPVYGYQWRTFNKTYRDGTIGNQDENDGDWNVYTDQLQNIITTLETNPNDRRMVCSAWNPNQMDMMALPPCHYAFTIVHINGKLNLCWKQRSCDLMLGVPSNIASYGLLLELICAHVDMVPGELVGILEDCHIYKNHMKGALEQIRRDPRDLPKLTLPDKLNIFEWKYNDVILDNYLPHKKIDMGEVSI